MVLQNLGPFGTARVRLEPLNDPPPFLWPDGRVFNSGFPPVFHSEPMLLPPMSALERLCALWRGQVWVWLHSHRILRRKLHRPWVDSPSKVLLSFPPLLLHFSGIQDPCFLQKDTYGSRWILVILRQSSLALSQSKPSCLDQIFGENLVKLPAGEQLDQKLICWFLLQRLLLCWSASHFHETVTLLRFAIRRYANSETDRYLKSNNYL